ncbi:MAG TPA: metallophosphoesterase [Gammaproteobacteria bacterium]
MDREVRRTAQTGDGGLVRIAAVGDVHVGLDMRGELRRSFSSVREHADVLLLAGDLTQHGSREEGRLVAEEVADVGIPTVAVLGNHDYHQDAQDAMRADLEAAGVTVLEGEGVVLELPGGRLGIAGVKGFGGGFAGACGSEFGELEMKAFIRHTKDKARALLRSLQALQCDVRVALTHYAPTKDTLLGEKLEIYPFLGSHLLGEAIDEGGCHLALHGHAHHGSERGITPGGVPVRNVARPLIRTAYQLLALRVHARGDEPAARRGAPASTTA